MRTLQEELQSLRQGPLYRRLRTADPHPGGATVQVDGVELVNFSSNDYLGLARSSALAEVFHKAVDRYGVGSGSSRLICGSTPAHRELESELAGFKHTEAAIAFSSGYSAAVGAITALAGKGDIVILDKLAHASLIDGARLSGATIRVFPHNHLEKLESHLNWARQKVAKDGRILVVTESIFSMDGDSAPLKDMIRLKNQSGALLLVDEAHAAGVLGPGGSGLGYGLDIDIQMGTMSKAMGVSGGYVCGSPELIDWLVNKSRSFIYSTAPPPAVAATAAEAVRIVKSAEGERLRTRLWKNIHQFSEAHGQEGIEQIPQNPESAIIPLILGREDKAVRISDELRKAGFFVPAIRYPSVPRNCARLRLTLSATHNREQIAELIATLREMLPG